MVYQLIDLLIDSGVINMPQHNTNGMSKAAKKRYAKGGSSPDAAKHAATVARLKKLVTTNFHRSHVALTTNPNFTAELGNASRPIDSSTCLILTPADLARFESMVKARRAKIVSGDHPNRSRIYTSEKIFKMMTWGPSGKGAVIDGTFSYSFLRENEGGAWYVHHLESTQVEMSHPAESDGDSSDELYFSSEESDSDYQSDWG